MCCSAGSKFIRDKPPWQRQTFCQGKLCLHEEGLLQHFLCEKALLERRARCPKQWQMEKFVIELSQSGGRRLAGGPLSPKVLSPL